VRKDGTDGDQEETDRQRDTYRDSDREASAILMTVDVRHYLVLLSRCASLALSPFPLIVSYKSEKTLCGAGLQGCRAQTPRKQHGWARGRS
jgi:hypothetical protein